MELWYPGAVRRLGPANKTYGVVEVPFGLTGHSSEGNFAGDMAVLDSQTRPRGSWNLYNPRSGPLIEHYALNAITWHAGSRASWGTIGMETEGFWYEPFTPSQEYNVVEFLSWAADNFDWGVLALESNVFEHKFWKPTTACPSDRYVWEVLLPAANAILGGNMPTAEYEELTAKIKAVRDSHSTAIWKLTQHALSIDGQVDDVVATTRALEKVVAQHFSTHNTGGSIIEKHGMVILAEVTALVEKTEAARTTLSAELARLRAFITEEGNSGQAQ